MGGEEQASDTPGAREVNLHTVSCLFLYLQLALFERLILFHLSIGSKSFKL
jgi:hypothetical protein